MGEERCGRKALSGIRLNFIVEGQTEETFVRDQLKPHLAQRSIWASVRCVQTSRKPNTKYRGGLRRYSQARDDISRWMREQPQPKHHDVRFTTMFDLFRLPDDFPGHHAAASNPDPISRATALENAMLEDIGDNRFVPYIQVHEFEALVLVNTSARGWTSLRHWDHPFRATASSPPATGLAWPPSTGGHDRAGGGW